MKEEREDQEQQQGVGNCEAFPVAINLFGLFRFTVKDERKSRLLRCISGNADNSRK